MVLYSTRIQIVTWLRLMHAGQTYSWVPTFKHTFHGTKHLSHAFSDQQRKTRTTVENNASCYGCRALGDTYEGNVIIADFRSKD